MQADDGLRTGQDEEGGVNDFIGGILWVSIGTLLLIGCMYAATAYLGKVGCHSQWEDSGMPVKWAVMAGCRVQLPDGTWIPADHYRAIEE